MLCQIQVAKAFEKYKYTLFFKKLETTHHNILLYSILFFLFPFFLTKSRSDRPVESMNKNMLSLDQSDDTAAQLHNYEGGSLDHCLKNGGQFYSRFVSILKLESSEKHKVLSGI